MLDRTLNLAAETPVFGRDDALPAGWAVSPAPVDYPAAVAAMEDRATAIAEGR
ncbi:MAG: lipoate-protein ligase, partial [Caulobacteraceae bacterium]|nr:lipoate-protein ligase [Caulobacteraceae bacterium]